jgi:cell division protein FtsA
VSGKVIVGLDIGTSKVCAIAAELNERGIQIIGLGEAVSNGMRKGMVSHMEATVYAIKKAVREAENTAGIRIKSVIAGLSGAHIRGESSTGFAAISGKEVRYSDRNRAVESAKAIYIPLDREVLHAVSTEFALDGQEGIMDPVGMTGARLDAKVYTITALSSAVQNIVKCCETACLDVADLVFSPLASAVSSISAEEMNSGVIICDVGAGTTDIAFFREGALRYATSLGVGGAHVTNDIAIGLRISTVEAERLKQKFGAAFTGRAVTDGKEIQISQSGGNLKTIPAGYIAEIIQPRSEEMIGMIRKELQRCSGYESAICGVVLTGGASLLNGFDTLAESLLGLPVRVGRPVNIRGRIAGVSTPVYSTGVGLAAYGQEFSPERSVHSGCLPDVLDGLKIWLKDKFGRRGQKIYLNN